MIDRGIPTGYRAALRVARSAMYALVGFIAVSALVWTPHSVVETMGIPLTIWWTTLVIVGSLTSLVGVIINRYRAEWIAIWPTVGGLVVYALTMFFLAIDSEPAKFASASAALALSVAMAYRGAELGAHAAKLRAEAQNGGTLRA